MGAWKNQISRCMTQPRSVEQALRIRTWGLRITQRSAAAQAAQAAAPARWRQLHQMRGLGGAKVRCGQPLLRS